MEANTEQIILEAARQLFLQKGFAMTSTAEIASAAGCNTAMIHYYYRSKEQLFMAFFMKEVEKISDNLIVISGEELSFFDKLEQIIVAHFDFIAANPSLPFLIFNEITTNPKRVEYIKEMVLRRVSRVLEPLDREFSEQVAHGNIRSMRAVDFLFNMVSLNVITFLAMPLITQFSGTSGDTFRASRKKEIVYTLINSIKADEK